MRKVRSPEELQLLWMMLDREFIKLRPASYKEVANQVLDWILMRERLRNNLEKNKKDQIKSDADTIKALNSMDTNDPEFSTIEKVFKRLCNKRGKAAMLLLQAAIEAKHHDISSRQRRFAKLPRIRKRHPLTSMVDSVVKKNPQISNHALFKSLLATSKTATKSPCTYNFEKAAFIPLDNKFKPIPKNNLSDYLYRAKERIKRANRLA